MAISRRSMLTGIAGAAFASIVSSPTAEATVFGTRDVSNRILELWLPHRTRVGLPTTREYAVAGGRKQRFANAHMYYSKGSGASIVSGKIKSTFEAAGGYRGLGLPIALEKSSRTYGAYTQGFSAGRVWWSSADGGKAVPAAKTVTLMGAKNFRDVAGEGAGIAVRGGRMRRHVVYRSSALGSTSKMDRYILQTLGVETIIALSSADPPSISGIGWVRYPVKNLSASTLAEKQRMYRAYVTNADNRASLGKALTLISKADEPVVFQCLRGWDRTGWLAAVLQALLGASSSTIRTEYLKSNQYLGSSLRREYLDAAWNEMVSRYGTVERYVAACGVSSATVSRLRKELIVR